MADRELIAATLTAGMLPSLPVPGRIGRGGSSTGGGSSGSGCLGGFPGLGLSR